MLTEYPTSWKKSLDPKALKHLVKQGETESVEFKLKTNHPEKIVREIVAFANSNGGKLLLGVSDDRQIKGLKFSDEDRFILQNAIEKYIYPKIDYDIECIRVEGEKDVLIFHISESPMKPHAVDLDGDPSNRKVYIRVADKSVQASKEMREVLKGQRKGKNLRFTFGEKEQKLMKYLEQSKFITISQFAQLADIPRKMASRTLILLALTNVLMIKPTGQNEDVFMLKTAS